MLSYKTCVYLYTYTLDIFGRGADATVQRVFCPHRSRHHSAGKLFSLDPLLWTILTGMRIGLFCLRARSLTCSPPASESRYDFEEFI